MKIFRHNDPIETHMYPRSLVYENLQDMALKNI